MIQSTGLVWTQVVKALVEKVLASPTQKTQLVEAKEVHHHFFIFIFCLNSLVWHLKLLNAHTKTQNTKLNIMITK